jgi:methyl-accepting chemotaxis protein
MHPKASGTCLEVNCAEGFSNSEYESFYNTVLVPIKTGATPASSYTKKGKAWRISVISFTFATVKYTLMATVSRDAILVASNAVQTAIKNSVITLIVLFAIGMFILAIAALELTIKMTRAIVDPIQDLRYICTKLANNDYSCTIPTNPSSSDMKQLLDAFSHLLVALKFGSDTYARGDVNLAKDVFSDALTLFETTENGKGMSACHNNLGVVETALKNYAAAEMHYIESINFVTKFLRQGNHISDDFERAQRTLSDRKGNLALLYLEKEEFI